jgi:hypothetical protein
MLTRLVGRDHANQSPTGVTLGCTLNSSKAIIDFAVSGYFPAPKVYVSLGVALNL